MEGRGLLRKRSLLFWCVAMAALALVGLMAFWLIWRCLGVTDPQTRATVSVTTVGGLGGSVFLVVKYRAQELAERQYATHVLETERRDATSKYERDEILMDQAVDMLVSASPQKRIAGARKLIAIADDQTAIERKQWAVTALCGFLRVSEGLDPVVEQIFLEALKQRLQSDAEDRGWSKCALDFRGAQFTQHVDLSGCVFHGPTDWRDVTFQEGSLFSDAEFSVSPLFENVTFCGRTEFERCGFGDDVEASFLLSHFEGDVNFRETTFGGVVRFGNLDGFLADSDSTDEGLFDVDGDPLEREDVALEQGEQKAPMSEQGEECCEGGVVVAKDSPLSPTFSGLAEFSGATFCKDAHFGLTGQKVGEVWVSDFSGETRFEGVAFCGDAFFGGVHFEQGVSFGKGRGRSVQSRTGLAEDVAVKPGEARGAVFSGAAYFEAARFDAADSDPADRQSRRRGVCASFGDVSFSGVVSFDDCVFDDEAQSLAGAVPADIVFSGSSTVKEPSFAGAQISCRKHRGKSERSWPPLLEIHPGERGDMPVGAFCPVGGCSPLQEDPEDPAESPDVGVEHPH